MWRIIKFLSAVCFLVLFVLLLSLEVPISIFILLLILSIIYIVFLSFLSTKKIIHILSTFVFLIMFSLNFILIMIINDIKQINSDKSIYEYVVLVDYKSDIKTLDVNVNKKVGIYDADEGVLDELKKYQMNIIKYQDHEKILNDLYNHKIDYAVVLKNMILDEYLDKIKIVKTFNIVKKLVKMTKVINVDKDSFNIYISGIDTYGKVETVSRSDVNIIMTVNPNTKKILLTFIPRDYYVPLYEKQGLNDKLTHSGIFGIDNTIHTVEDLLDIDINYYVKLNFTGIIDIVDLIGEIEVDLDSTFTTLSGVTFIKGKNYLDGEKTLFLIRERKTFQDGDRTRGKNEQLVIRAIIDKLKNTPSYKYMFLFNDIKDKVQSNITYQEVKKYLENNDLNYEITDNSIDGFDDYDYTYSYPNRKLYVMKINEDSVNYASKLIKNYL